MKFILTAIMILLHHKRSQDNFESNTEFNGFQEEDASDTNQTSSPSPYLISSKITMKTHNFRKM
jgi:hypothetical protein